MFFSVVRGLFVRGVKDTLKLNPQYKVLNWSRKPHGLAARTSALQGAASCDVAKPSSGIKTHASIVQPPELYSVGRYDDVRVGVYPSKWYQNRCVHMGLDIGAPVGTPVHLPLDGQVVSLEVDDTGFGPSVITEHSRPVCCYLNAKTSSPVKHNCILQNTSRPSTAHQSLNRQSVDFQSTSSQSVDSQSSSRGPSPNPSSSCRSTTSCEQKIYILWGHLSLKTWYELELGQTLKAGDVLGRLGGSHENAGSGFFARAEARDTFLHHAVQPPITWSQTEHPPVGGHSMESSPVGSLPMECPPVGWPPHIHMQILYSRPRTISEVPGVVGLDDRSEALQLYPDPRCLFGPVYEDS